MTISSVLTAQLPELQPQDPGARLLLFGIRQMGAHGLTDACAAHAFITAFGKDFRRPLVLARAMVAEVSAASKRPVRIAPWCCPRMTGAEAALLRVIAHANADPRRAGLLLADLLDARDIGGVLSTAQALAASFADQGLAIE